MNIHLPAILGLTRYQGFDPSPDESWAHNVANHANQFHLMSVQKQALRRPNGKLSQDEVSCVSQSNVAALCSQVSERLCFPVLV